MEKLFREKRLVMRIAIIATGIFLSWISSDFPLALWLQIASPGGGSIFASPPKLFLGIQFLCLALAWSILLWMALYECISQLVVLPFIQKMLFSSEKAIPTLASLARSQKTASSPLQINRYPGV